MGKQLAKRKVIEIIITIIITIIIIIIIIIEGKRDNEKEQE